MNDIVSSAHYSNRRGQTLVEALVALTILTTGFLGIATLLTKSFQLNRITSENTQATYLASEGVELAKNIIDYDVYSGIAAGGDGSTNWGCSFNLASGSANFDLQYDTMPPICPTALGDKTNTAPDPLYYDKTTGFYSYTQNANTVKSNFTRTITITIVSAYEIDVKSKVTWANGLLSNSVVIEDDFYDWHP